MSTDDWDDWEEDPPNAVSSASMHKAEETAANVARLEQSIADVQSQLRGFQIEMADEVVIEKVNSRLGSTSFSSFMKYYRNESAEAQTRQTIVADLHRMEYEVKAEGQSFVDKSLIEALYRNTPSHELWRLANQSLLASPLAALQRTFLKPELGVTLRNTRTCFNIDFDKESLLCTSTFVLGCGSSVVSVDLARFSCDVRISLGKGSAVTTVRRPELTQVFDEQLKEVAASIVVDMEGEQRVPRRPDLADVAITPALLKQTAVETGTSLAEGLVRGIGKIVGADKNNAPVLSFRELAAQAEREQAERERWEQEKREAANASGGWGWGALLSNIGSAISEVINDGVEPELRSAEECARQNPEPLELYRREEPKDEEPLTLYRREEPKDEEPLTLYRREEPKDEEPLPLYTREEPKDEEPLTLYRREEPKDEEPLTLYTREEPKDEEQEPSGDIRASVVSAAPTAEQPPPEPLPTEEPPLESAAVSMSVEEHALPAPVPKPVVAPAESHPQQQSESQAVSAPPPVGKEGVATVPTRTRPVRNRAKRAAA